MCHTINYEVEVKNLPRGELKVQGNSSRAKWTFFLFSRCLSANVGEILVRVGKIDGFSFITMVLGRKFSFYECENQSVPLVDFLHVEVPFSFKSKGARPYLPLTPYHD